MDDTNVRTNVTIAFAEFIANYAPKKFRGRGYPYNRRCLSVVYFYKRFRSVSNRNTPKSLLTLYRYCLLTRSAKRELPLCNTCFPTYVLISRDFNVLFFLVLFLTLDQQHWVKRFKHYTLDPVINSIYISNPPKGDCPLFHLFPWTALIATSRN